MIVGMMALTEVVVMMVRTTFFSLLSLSLSAYLEQDSFANKFSENRRNPFNKSKGKARNQHPWFFSGTLISLALLKTVEKGLYAPV